MHICLIAIKVKSDLVWQTIPMIKGPQGDSAYQIALNNGFEGTEEEWLESLSHGPKGDDGVSGDTPQFIFKRTADSIAPITPESTGDAIPETWSNRPLGVTAVAKYEWVCMRVKSNNIWSVFSAPALWAIYGFGDSLPEIYIEDVNNLQETLNSLETSISNKIDDSLLPELETIKLPGADAFGVILPKYIPAATSTSFGGIKLGSTLVMDQNGVANVQLKMRELDEALTADPEDGAAIIWDKATQKYKNTILSISGTFHPYKGNINLDLTAKTLKSVNLLLPKTVPTIANNEVGIYALENGYTLEDPGAGGVSILDDLDDVLLANQANGDSLFKEGLNFVNKPAYTKDQVDTLFLGLSTNYHPYGGSDLIDFRARRLYSKVLFIPTGEFIPPDAGVAIFAKENGYSIVDPETSISEFADLSDISALTWLNGQTIMYRNGIFSNESIYNKGEVDTLLGNLNMSNYLTKTEALSKYHPKFGLDNGTPLDLTADRLKSNVLLIPKDEPIALENNEVAIYATENGYTLVDPQGSSGTLIGLEDVLIDTPLENQALLYVFATQKWINKTLSFNMFGDSLSADLVATNDLRRFVTITQIAEWNAKWNYDENTIKNVKVNLAADSEKLGGIDASKYWHDANSNLFTVDWKARVLRSKSLSIPKELPVDLLNNEVGLFALENGYSLEEPGGGTAVTVLNDLLDVINVLPNQNDILYYNLINSAYVNGPLLFNMISGNLDSSRITTTNTTRFVSDSQIAFWNAKEDAANKNQPGGYVGLNLTGKIDYAFIPDSILGQVKWGGTFDVNGLITSPVAALNGLNINTLSATDYSGYYFIAQADITVSGIELKVGDWLISNGAAGWAKVDNTDAVTSVNGRIGAVTLTKSDVGLSNVDNTADSLKNVLSATKLFTPRTLWGKSFDGTANVSGDLVDVGHLTGNGILSMGAILIPKVAYAGIPNNAVSIYALENGYSVVDPEAGTVGSLNDLSDVTLIARADKQLLYYSNALGEFTNGLIDFSFIQGSLGADRVLETVDRKFLTPTYISTWNAKQNALAFVETTEGRFLRDDNTFQLMEPPVGGFANNLYFSSIPSDIGGYYTLSYNADSTTTNVSTAVQVTDGDKLVATYLYPTGVDVEDFPGGLWSFAFYGNVDIAVGITQIGVQYFKRATNGVETNLFTSWSSDINNTANGYIKFDSTQPIFDVSPTDRMGARILVRTTHVGIVNITYQLGDGYAAYLNNPNRIRHSQLRALNGDNNFLHITLTEKTNYQAGYAHSLLTGNPHSTYMSHIMDTTFTGLQSGHVMMYNASTGKWYNSFVDMTEVVDLADALATKQNQLNGTGLVRMNGTGVSYDNNSYALTSHNHNGTYIPVGGLYLLSDGLSALTSTVATTNFRTSIFGAATIGWQIKAWRWDDVPTLLSGYNSSYGTAIVWAGSDTHGFLALDYSTPNATIGGGYSDNISWRAKLYHTGNIATIKSDLGLGSNAYTSTAYLPLSGGDLSGKLRLFQASKLRWELAYSDAFLYAEDNDIARAAQYYHYAANQLRFYSKNATGADSGIDLRVYNGASYQAVLHAGNYTSYAAPSSGSANYIQNQDSVAQSASIKINGRIQIDRNTTGLIFNRAATNNYCGINYWTANEYQWFVGMRENLSSNNYIIYNEGTGTDALTISKANNSATFASTIQATNATFTNLSTGYIPYKTSGAFGNSPISISGGSTYISGGGTYDSPKSLILTHLEPSVYSAYIGIRQEGLGYAHLSFGTRSASTDYMGTLNIGNGNVGVGYFGRSEKFAVAGNAYFRDGLWSSGVIETTSYFKGRSGSIIGDALTSPSLGSISSMSLGVSGYFSYGTAIGVTGDGNTWFQSQRFDGGQSIYDLIFQPLGGNVAIGYSGSINHKLKVNGTGYFNGLLTIQPTTGSYSEGIRIGAYSGWSNVQFKVNTANTTGTQSGQWLIGVNPADTWCMVKGGSESASTIPSNGLAIPYTLANIYFNSNIMYHAGNANRTDISWSASSVKIGDNWEAIPNGTTLELRFNTSAKMYLSDSGGLSAAAFYHTSDMRLKNVIQPLGNVLDTIKNFKTFYYTEKGGSKIILGMSAQEFEQYFNPLVGKDSKGYLALEYPRIGVIAIKAIQELAQRQDSLAKKVFELELEVKQLRAQLCHK